MRQTITSRYIRAREILFNRAQTLVTGRSPSRYYSSKSFPMMNSATSLHNGFLPYYPRNRFTCTRQLSSNYSPFSSSRTSPYFLKRINAFVSDIPSKPSSQNPVNFQFHFFLVEFCVCAVSVLFLLFSSCF